MFNDVNDIAEFYNNNTDNEHDRLVRHQLEHDLTWRYLDQYLPPSGHILEIGAATGRYTLELAKRGWKLTSVDLSAAMIERCRQNLADEGLDDRVQLLVADARDLDPVTAKDFDAAILMGPLYHLFTEADRKLALTQIHDRLRVGGILFSTFISRFGIMGDLMKNVPEWVEDEGEVRSILERGRDPHDYHQNHQGSFRGYFAKVSEIAPLHESVGFETLIVAGVEPGISADDESYNKLVGKRRQLWLDLLYEISTEPSTVGSSRHLLYVGRKK